MALVTASQHISGEVEHLERREAEALMAVRQARRHLAAVRAKLNRRRAGRRSAEPEQLELFPEL